MIQGNVLVLPSYRILPVVDPFLFSPLRCSLIIRRNCYFKQEKLLVSQAAGIRDQPRGTASRSPKILGPRVIYIFFAASPRSRRSLISYTEQVHRGYETTPGSARIINSRHQVRGGGWSLLVATSAFVPVLANLEPLIRTLR